MKIIPSIPCFKLCLTLIIKLLYSNFYQTMYLFILNISLNVLPYGENGLYTIIALNNGTDIFKQTLLTQIRLLITVLTYIHSIPLWTFTSKCCGEPFCCSYFCCHISDSFHVCFIVSLYCIYPAIRLGFPHSRKTTNNQISPMEFCYNTLFYPS